MKARSIAALALLVTSVSAQAITIDYDAFLSGPAEAPPNASPGTGFAIVSYDTVSHMMKIHVDFAGLTGTTTASHIHAATAVPGVGTAGVATTTPTFAGFPLGVTAGSYTTVLDLTLASSYNPTFITGHGGTTASAEAFLTASMAAGTAYLNIHSSTFPGGEIRGFLKLAHVPEGSETAALMVLGLMGMVFFARNQRREAVV